MTYNIVLCACDECPENSNCKRYVLYNMNEGVKNDLNNSGQLISKNLYKQYCSVNGYKLKMKLDNDMNETDNSDSSNSDKKESEENV